MACRWHPQAARRFREEQCPWLQVIMKTSRNSVLESRKTKRIQFMERNLKVNPCVLESWLVFYRFLEMIFQAKIKLTNDMKNFL